MPIFSISNNTLKKIKELSFKNEKREIQKICENNLQNLFNLEFVKSEFSLNHLRIDTLAFDNETNSFVILEYKKDKNFSVVDQGIAYLALLLNNKADFILEFNESKNKSLKRNDVDWEASKVILYFLHFSF
jgi:RecB family endonuclease NucS